MTVSPDPAVPLPDRLRAGLRDAMRARDQVAVRALRTALGAIGNAEAPPIEAAPTAPQPPAVGRLVEHPRLELSDEQLAEVLRAEVADRRDTIAQYLRAGREAPAAELEAEISVLERYL